MFKVSELARRDFINVLDGRRLGPVKDMHIDSRGRVRALVLRNGKKLFGLFSAGRDVVVPWEQIKIVGVHAVLVEVGEQAAADGILYTQGR